MGTRTAARTRSKAKRKALHQRTQRNRTAGCGQTPDESSSLKQVAAAALILGQNVTKTAEALGVDRRTVQRWGKHDPEFRQVLDETKQEVIVTSRQSLLALAESAVEIVETKLAVEHNPRMALAFLRGIGAISPQPLASGPATAETKNENRAETATLANADLSTHNAQSNVHESATVDGDHDEEPIYELADLSSQQRAALAGLFVGQSVAEVAQTVSTSEETILGWLRQDAGFFTVLSGLQFERIVHLKHRLLKLITTAIEIVRAGIAAGDGRLALALVRGLGLLR